MGKLKTLLAKKGPSDNSTTYTKDMADGVLAISDSSAALDMLVSGVKSGNLADSSDFKDAFSALPGDAMVKIYAPGSSMLAAAKSLNNSSSSSSSSLFGSGSSLGSSLGTTGSLGATGGLGTTGSTTSSSGTSSTITNLLNKAIGGASLKSAAFAISSSSDGFHLDGVFKGGTKLSNSSASLLDTLPDSTALAVDLSGSAVGIDTYVNKLTSNPKYSTQIPAMETMLGMKVSDVAKLFGGEMALYLTDAGIGFQLKSSDPGKVSTLIDKVIGASSSMSGSTSAPPEVTTTTIGGVSAKTITFPSSSSTLGGTSLYWGSKDGYFFLVTAADVLATGTKLSDDPVYSAAKKELSLPSKAAVSFYVPFKKLTDLRNSTNPMIKSLSSSFASGAGSNLSGARNILQNGPAALFGYVSGDGDTTNLKIVVTMK